jgi:hypothetical protein
MNTLLSSPSESKDLIAPVDAAVPRLGQASSGPAVYAFVEAIPASFLRALDDFAQGRVVSDDVALYQPPPNA